MTLAPVPLEATTIAVLGQQPAPGAKQGPGALRTSFAVRSDVTETIDLSIVIPAYNEEVRLPATLAAIRVDLDRRPERSEILVVDDGSTDRTSEVAAAGGARVLRLGANRGKGAAVRAGVGAARGQYILVSDADLSTPISEYENLRRALDAGAIVAIGSRAVGGARIRQAQPRHRRTMGRVFNGLVRAFVLPGVRDTQCGFKLFHADAAHAAFRQSKVDGFAFDVEILATIQDLGGTIAEVPVEWHDSPQSRVRPLSDVPQMVRDVFRIRRRLRKPITDRR